MNAATKLAFHSGISSVVSRAATPGGPRRQLLAATAILAGAISLAAGSLEIQAHHAARRAELVETASTAQAKLYADRIAAAVRAYVQRLAALSREEGLIGLFEEARADRLGAAETEYLAHFDRAVRLRLVLPGAARIDHGGTAPMRYTALELLRRAETTADAIPVEVVLFGNEQQHIVIIERVLAPDGRLRGLLHLSVQPDLIAVALAGLEGPECCLEVLQPLISSRSLTLANRGGHGRQAVLSGVTVPVPGTRWLLRYSPAGHEEEVIADRVKVEFWTGTDPKAVLAALLGIALFAAGLVYLRWSPLPHRAPSSSPLGTVATERDAEAPQALTQKSGAMELTCTARPVESERVAEGIFRTDGVEGVLNRTLTPKVLSQLGLAVAGEVLEAGYDAIVVGCDEGPSNATVRDAVIPGILEGGCAVIDLKTTAPPLVLFAAHLLNTGAGLWVAEGDHDCEGNRLSLLVGDEVPLPVEGTRLMQRIEAHAFPSGSGERQFLDIEPHYVRRLTDDIPIALTRQLCLVVACRDGSIQGLASQVLRVLGHEIIEVSTVAGSPHGHGRPVGDPLPRMSEQVLSQRADMGLYFDLGGCRLRVIDDQGQSVALERLMCLYAGQILARHPGQAIVYDAECGDGLGDWIARLGGRPTVCRPGLGSLMLTMRYASSPLGCSGEGHIMFRDRWFGSADGLYAAARLLELVTARSASLTEMLREAPTVAEA